MSYICVFIYLRKYNLHTKMIDIMSNDSSRKSVIEYLNCKEEELVNCVAVTIDDVPSLIVYPGDKKIDLDKYQSVFDEKFNKINYNLLQEKVGYSLGELCPFAVKKGVKIYLDESLKYLKNIYLLCGSPFCVVKLKLEELEISVKNEKWVDICK